MQGLLAMCYLYGDDCISNFELSLELANFSAEAGVGYGQCVLGIHFMWSCWSNVKDVNRALLFLEKVDI
jgi:hypothetical protein